MVVEHGIPLPSFTYLRRKGNSKEITYHKKENKTANIKFMSQYMLSCFRHGMISIEKYMQYVANQT
jgi:hypothetical protein